MLNVACNLHASNYSRFESTLIDKARQPFFYFSDHQIINNNGRATHRGTEGKLLGISWKTKVSDCQFIENHSSLSRIEINIENHNFPNFLE